MKKQKIKIECGKCGEVGVYEFFEHEFGKMVNTECEHCGFAQAGYVSPPTPPARRAHQPPPRPKPGSPNGHGDKPGSKEDLERMHQIIAKSYSKADLAKIEALTGKRKR